MNYSFKKLNCKRRRNEAVVKVWRITEMVKGGRYWSPSEYHRRG